MNPAHHFALDVAEGALEAALEAAATLPHPSVAGAAAERTRRALERLQRAVETADDDVDHLMALADEAADAATRRAVGPSRRVR